MPHLSFAQKSVGEEPKCVLFDLFTPYVKTELVVTFTKIMDSARALEYHSPTVIEYPL